MTDIPAEILSKAKEIYEGSWPDPVAAIAEALMEERAKASDLLEALRGMLPEANTGDQHCRPDFITCEVARDAIAKAERNQS